MADAYKLLSQPLTDFAADRSVALLIGANSGNPELASGTCFRICSRCFIATAAHPIRSIPESEIDLVHSHAWTHSHTPIERIGTRGGTPDTPVDVGYLELTQTNANALGKTFISLRSLEAFSIPPAGQWIFAYGYPTSVVPQNLAAQAQFPISGMGMFTDPLPEPAWPAQACPAVDVAYDYLSSAHYGAQGFSIPVPNCQGMSGGSIWRFDPNARGLIGTHTARWVAIQRAWLPGSRKAYGNQLQHLLLLLAADYPSLAPKIYLHLAASWCRSKLWRHAA